MISQVKTLLLHIRDVSSDKAAQVLQRVVQRGSQLFSLTILPTRPEAVLVRPKELFGLLASLAVNL